MFIQVIRLTGSLLLLILVSTLFFASLTGSNVMAPSLASSITQLTRATDRLTRYLSHFKFISKCLDNNYIPKGMTTRFGKSALPQNASLLLQVDQTMQTASKEIAVACKNTYAILAEQQREIIQTTLYNIQQLFDFHEFETARRFQHYLYKRQSRQLATKKRKKFVSLLESVRLCEHLSALPKKKKKKTRRFKRRDPIPITPTQLADHAEEHRPQIVYNLSSVPITETHERLLGLNHNFCPVPRTVDGNGFMEDIIEGNRKIRLKEWIMDRDEPDANEEDMDSPLPRFYKKNYWCPPVGRDSSLDAFCDSLRTLAENFDFTAVQTRDNLSPTERRALRELQQMVKNRIVRISRADKGGAVVLQDVSDYVKEGRRLLSNPEHYTTVPKDPTSNIARASNKFIDDLKTQEVIDEKTHEWARLDPHNVRPHVFYHVPKIHKTLVNPPGRPIVSGIGGPTETLSKLVDHWLRPLVTRLPSYLQDSTHALRVIQDWNRRFGPFDDNVMLVTLDVVNLYGSIPHQDIEKAIRFFLRDNADLSLPSAETIIPIIRHVLKNNYFTFEDTVYHQRSGTAMGTPMAPTVANLFMGWLEINLLELSPIQLEEDIWKRYIDDILLLWRGSLENLYSFVSSLNSHHDSITFTMNNSRSAIPFLDILIKLENGYLTTELYTKNTDTHSFLPHKSCHPHHVIRNIPFGQFLRVRRLCSSFDKFMEHSSEMARHLKNRGYPDTLVKTAIQRAANIPREETLTYRPKKNDGRVPFVITHNPRNPPLRKWLSDKMNILHNSTRMATCMPNVPIIGERKCRSLKNILMPSLLPVIPTGPDEAGCFPCPNKCVICREHLVPGNRFSSSQTGETFTIRQRFTCESKNIIYLLFCSTCEYSQYVGETMCSLKTRF